MKATNWEKTLDSDLEGPTLPGIVRRAVLDAWQQDSDTVRRRPSPPLVLAIGGIDDTNCHEPVATYGADGVAVIRSILQADDPAQMTHQIKTNMRNPPFEPRDFEKA